MNVIRTSRNIAIIALLLSLLFHSSSILYVFSQKTRNSSHSLFEQHKEKQDTTKREKQKKDTEWVETRARAGNFGAPVVFEDISDDDSDDISQLPDEIIANDIEVLNKSIDTQNIPTNLEKNISEQIHEPQQTPLQQEEKKITGTHFAAEQPIKSSVQKAHSTQQKKTVPKKTPQKKHAASKPPLTLAQLTQGFLHQPKKHAGSYGISMLGMKQGIPSDEQMKYERYIQKLSWCLQNAFNIHRHQMPAFSSDTIIYLWFSLARDGTLQQLVIRKSSGNTFLDNFVTFLFREASVSFPPVPGYLPDDPFQITFMIHP